MSTTTKLKKNRNGRWMCPTKGCKYTNEDHRSVNSHQWHQHTSKRRRRSTTTRAKPLVSRQFCPHCDKPVVIGG
jgi:hypothetical protein